MFVYLTDGKFAILERLNVNLAQKHVYKKMKVGKGFTSSLPLNLSTLST